MHASANAFNDYFDLKNGVDSPDSPTVLYRPHGVFEGWLSPKTLLGIAITFMTLALAIGGSLAAFRTAWLAPIIGLGIILNIFYTGLRQYSLKYIALGEPAVFLAFGPLIIMGSCAVQTRTFPTDTFLLSIPTGILAALVLFANNLRDREFDARKNIKTLATIMTPQAGKRLFTFMAVLPYPIIGAAVMAGIIRWPALLVLASTPTAIKIIKLFSKEIPVNADALTSEIVLFFNFLLLAGIIAGILL